MASGLRAYVEPVSYTHLAGLIFLLIFGRQSPVYFFLMKLGMKVVFSVPGIIIATVFVTLSLIHI